jgi:hypothetical protein
MDTSMNGDDDVKNIMESLAILFTAGFIFISVAYRVTELDILLPVAITLGTFSYHFLMRLIVGYGIDAAYHNRMNYHRNWFQHRKWEKEFYKKLKVKSWKDKMPTYDADTFSFELHSMEEIVMAMCQSEVVHEINVVLSFVPLFLAISFGTFGVFLSTSILAAGFDMMFVVMQRYNRPRLVKLLGKVE